MVLSASSPRHSQSHPSRVRGSQHRNETVRATGEPVALFTGAWVSTHAATRECCPERRRTPDGCVDLKKRFVESAPRGTVVAPLTGAWTSTREPRGRAPVQVAPFTGAWISTAHAGYGGVTASRRPFPGGVDLNLIRNAGHAEVKSHPVRVRGFQDQRPAHAAILDRFAPSQVRGFQSRSDRKSQHPLVAPPSVRGFQQRHRRL